VPLCAALRATAHPCADASWREKSKQIAAAHYGPRSVVDTICMNDFHIALLWLRSLEIAIGHSPVLMLSELELHDLFVRYRSPYKA